MTKPIRVRIGHKVGAALLLSIFIYDQAQLSRELMTHSNSKCFDAASNRYPEFDDIPIAPSYIGGPLNMKHPNQAVHFAEFGLGHRLAKISSAWHLTKALNLTRLVLFWGDCQGDPSNLAPRLFGSDTIDVPGTEHMAKESEANGNVGKTLKVKNDVIGYYNGANFKRHKVVLPKSVGGNDCPFLAKYKSDVELYRILLKRFVGKGDLMKFMDDNRFKEHFVIGLHLRLGNGEQAHFENVGRGVDNEMDFVNNLLTLIKKFVEELKTSHPQRFIPHKCSKSTANKVPLIFLATDSPKYIPIISNYTKQFDIETIVMPQDRVEKGVTLSIKQGEKCAKGWHDMLLDDIVLSFSDVLIAARHSTFTQSLPMPLVFDRSNGVKGPHFCEVGDSGTTMTCLEDMRTWLFRDSPSKTFTYSTEDAGNVQEVIHHMTVHFPDVELPDAFFAAAKFLNPPIKSETKGKGGWYGVKPRSTMTFGGDGLSWFDNKFRGKTESCPSCTHFTHS